jgi:hypothetical protein
VSDQIPQIPPGVEGRDLVAVMNDRIRRINLALGGGAPAGSTSAAIAYGTRNTRLQRPISDYGDGALFVETDQGAIFQKQNGAWVGIGAAGAVAYASGNYTLTTAYDSIPGATLTLARAGRYLIRGCFDMLGSGANDATWAAFGQLIAGPSGNEVVQGPANAITLLAPLVIVVAGTGVTGSPVVIGLRAMVTQQWSYTATANDVVTLQAKKNGGTGGSFAAGATSIEALWLGP